MYAVRPPTISAPQPAAMTGGPSAGPTLRTRPASAQHTAPAPWNSAYGPVRPNQVIVDTTTSRRDVGEVSGVERPVIQDDLGTARQTLEFDGPSLGIEHHARLVRAQVGVQRAVLGCIDPGHERRLAPCPETAGRLDVNHVRPVVREQLAAIARGDRAGDIEHLDPVQGRIGSRRGFGANGHGAFLHTYASARK